MDWQIVYALIDTSNWKPWSKKVLLSISWLTEISYIRGDVMVDLHSDTIKDAPDYDPDENLDTQYEESLYRYYNESIHEHR
jgi:hypothetical protein